MLLALVAMYLVADRWSGGGFGWDRLTHDHGGPLRGRPLAYAGLALLIILSLINWRYGVLSLSFVWWRAFGWKDTGGSMTPHTAEETFRLFLRHMYAAVALPLAYYLGLNWKIGLITLPLWAAAAALLGYWLAKGYDKGVDRNPIVESGRGALFGLMFWTLLQG